jgi:HK97 family phage prohead protease
MASYRKKKKKLRQGLTMARMAEEKRQILTRAAPKTKTETNPKEKNKGIRELCDCQIRAVEGEGNERTFTLSFSSEEPYDRWFGTEILDHSEGCVDLDRLNSIGVVLFNHDRSAVVGKINRAWIEEGRGNAEITFDSDDMSETIYQKVKGGTLKGVSVGYMVENWEEVMPNKQSQDGRFTGPCSIAKKWAPYEVSIVSVPADPTVGVGRSLDDGGVDEFYETYVRQLQYNKNLTKGGNHHE